MGCHIIFYNTPACFDWLKFRMILRSSENRIALQLSRFGRVCIPAWGQIFCIIRIVPVLTCPSSTECHFSPTIRKVPLFVLLKQGTHHPQTHYDIWHCPLLLKSYLECLVKVGPQTISKNCPSSFDHDNPLSAC